MELFPMLALNVEEWIQALEYSIRDGAMNCPHSPFAVLCS